MTHHVPPHRRRDLLNAIGAATIAAAWMSFLLICAGGMVFSAILFWNIVHG